MSSPISGFTAVPNPQMLAFMPIQSYLMMYFAGSAWQFGKRKISAKSNEEFNKLTMKTLLEEHTMELKSVIPTLEKSLNDVTPLVSVLIEQYGDFIREALAAAPQALENAIAPTSLAGQLVHPDTSSGQADAWKSLSNFLAMLVGQLPSLPEAEARIGTGQGDRIEDSIIAQEDNAYEERLRKHKAAAAAGNLRRQQEKELASIKTRNIPLVHQIAIQSQRGTSVKRKAGQTQKLARLQLQQALARAFQLEQRMNAPNSNASATNKRMVKRKREAIQTELTGLLLRYDFTS